MKRFFERASTVSDRAAQFVIMALMVGISLLTFAQVIFRYFLNYSLYWSEELARYVLIWITFIGASIGFKHKAHMGIDFIFRRLNPPKQRVATVIVDATVLLMALVMLIWGYQLSLFVRIQRSPALFLSMTIPYISIAVGGLLVVIHSVAFLAGDIEAFRKRDDS